MLPAAESAVREALAALGGPTWRDRKQAADALAHALREVDTAALTLTMEALLDLFVGHDVEPRAGAREVLLAFPAALRPCLRARLDRDPHERALVELLGEIPEAVDGPRLVACLDPLRFGPNLRAAAAAGLGRIGDALAVAALLELLADRSDVLRVAALDALREAGAVVDPSAVVPLLDSPICRKAAAGVMGESRNADAVAPLVGLLGDGMAAVRAAAALALARLDESLDAAGQTYEVGAALARAPAELKQRLRPLLEHREPTVRQAAIRLCALAGDVDSITTLLEVMDDPVAQDRGIAMVAAFGVAANAVLRAAAERVAPAQREHLYRLIGALPQGRVDPVLLECLTAGLRDDGEDAAVAAAESLAALGDRRCLAPLYRAMAEEGRLGETAADAVAAVLGRSNTGSEDLALIVGSPWPAEGSLARNLCRVVGSLGSARWAPELVGLLGSADPSVRCAAAIALGHLPGDHEGADALAFALADEEPLVRAAACRALGQLAPPQAPAALLAATHDRAAQVRAAAVAALVALDNPVALPRLRAIVVEDTAPAVVVHAIAGLASSGRDQDLTMLMSLSLSADHEVVKAAARALASFQPHRATAALVGLCSHARWDVRWAAAQALGKRRDATSLGAMQRVLADERDPLVRQALTEAIAELDGTRARERRG
ncbi:MAG: HEAT repeat domain-containing protein [Nannocystaceae bacterium]